MALGRRPPSSSRRTAALRMPSPSWTTPSCVGATSGGQASVCSLPVRSPFNTGCLPLNHSDNPGVIGVSHRGDSSPPCTIHTVVFTWRILQEGARVCSAPPRKIHTVRAYMAYLTGRGALATQPASGRLRSARRRCAPRPCKIRHFTPGLPLELRGKQPALKGRKLLLPAVGTQCVTLQGGGAAAAGSTATTAAAVAHSRCGCPFDAGCLPLNYSGKCTVSPYKHSI
jgi:hypothetical protein